MLDVGTDRQSLLDDPLYMGNRHPRVPPDEYDTFLDAFVETATRLFPHAMLHWEDIGLAQRPRLLDRYRDRLLTFNDDIQGTGAVNLAAVLAAVRATGTSLADHRIVIYGAGTAGTGIADQLRAQMLADGLTEEQACARIWAIDRHGPAHHRHGWPQRRAAPMRPASGRGRRLAAGRRPRRRRPGRGRRPGAADDPDRHVDQVRRVHRGRSSGRWRRTSSGR